PDRRQRLSGGGRQRLTVLVPEVDEDVDEDERVGVGHSRGKPYPDGRAPKRRQSLQNRRTVSRSSTATLTLVTARRSIRRHRAWTESSSCSPRRPTFRTRTATAASEAATASTSVPKKSVSRKAAST